MINLSFQFWNKSAPINIPVTLQGFSFPRESVQPVMDMTLPLYLEGPRTGVLLGGDCGLGDKGGGSSRGPWDSPNVKGKTECVLVCSSCCNKVPQTGWFKQQTLISHLFLRLS